jgi:hypothetical protein
MVGGSIDRTRFLTIVRAIVRRAADGGRGVHIFGEMVNMLWAAGNRAAALELEFRWNELQDMIPFILCCGYRVGDLAGGMAEDLFTAIWTAHGHVLPAESYAGLMGPGERLAAIAHL